MSGTDTKNRTIDYTLAGILIIVSVAYYMSYYNYGLLMLDEGYLLDPVMRVSRGEVPYRDFHHIYAPGRFFVFAGLFKLFGPNATIVRIVWLALLSIGSALAYLITRPFTSRPFAVMAGILLTAAPGPWHKALFMFSIFLLLLVYYKYADNPGNRWALLSGLTTGLVFIFRQDVAVYGLVAFSVIVFVNNYKDIRTLFKHSMVLIGGFLCLLSPLLLYFFAKGALSEMLSQVLFAGRTSSAALSLPFPGLAIIKEAGWVGFSKLILYYLPFVVYASLLIIILSGWRHVIDKDSEYQKLILILIMGVLSLMQLMYRSGLGHLWQVLPIAYVGTAVLLGKLYIALSRRIYLRHVTGVLGVVLVAVVVTLSLSNISSGSIIVKDSVDVKLPYGRIPIYVPSQEAKNIVRLNDFVQENTKPGSYILALPDVPALYYILDRRNPLYFEAFLPGMGDSEAEQRRAIRDIEEKDVKYVILNKNEILEDLPGRRFEEYCPILYKYIISNYSKVEVIGEYVVMRRSDKG